MTETANPSPTRDAILEVIRQADEPLQPKEISERADRPKDSVQKALGKMVENGTLSKPAYGKYSLPKRQDGGTDLDLDTGGGAGEEVEALFRETAVMTVYTDVKASAGDGRVVYPDDAEHTMELPRHFISRILGFTPPRTVGAMTADGDSMRPTIQDGDLILYRPIKEVRDGGVYVLLVDDRQVVKRVQVISGGGYRLISDNSYHGYSNETLLPAESGEVLVNEETGRSVDLRVVGSVIFPRRDTDHLHVQQVAEIIRGVMNGDPMEQLRG